MPYQNIDASISAADLQAIKDAFATIKQKLPFLVNLTIDERRATFKAGPNSLSFVQNALSAAQNFSQILPPSFDLVGFHSLIWKIACSGVTRHSMSLVLDNPVPRWHS